MTLSLRFATISTVEGAIKRPINKEKKMFRVIDTNETPSLIVSKNANKSRAITEAANKYRNVPTVKLTVQKRNSAGKFETVGTFQSK